MRFLVTAIGSIAADAVITSLRKHFPGSKIIGTDIHPKEWLYLSGKVDAFFTIPRATNPKFITSLNKILDQQNIDLILPLTDPEVDALSKNRSQLKNDSTILTLPDDDVVKKCRDKKDFVRSLKEIKEINLIESISKEKLQNKDFSFPIVAKPKKGRSSKGLRYIWSEVELSVLDDDYIIQPFVKGDVITVDVVRDGPGNFACLSRRELIRSSNGAGLSVEVFQDNKIEKLISRIVEKLNITGCMNIEFIESHGLYYLCLLYTSPSPRDS